MPRRPAGAFRERTTDELVIDDERSFRHVALFWDLKAILVRDRYVFRVLPEKYAGRWDRALLLNLTYWDGRGGDVLESERAPADVIAHAAWHHLAAQALAIPPGSRLSAEAMVLGESIASGFDVYLVGRLLGHAPRSAFLTTQVAAMAETARGAGLTEREFERLLQGIAGDPEAAFADLRQLLYDATLALLPCCGAGDALAALARFDGHRLAALLHHYELSNWALYVRAYARAPRVPDRRARALAAMLDEERDPLAWLTSAWVSSRLQ